jgi:hypothetical protein
MKCQFCGQNSVIVKYYTTKTGEKKAIRYCIKCGRRTHAQRVVK